MTLQYNLISEFRATINGVEFNDQYLCEFVHEFLNVFNDKYLLDIPKDFVIYFKNLIEYLYDKSVNLTYERLSDLFLIALYDSSSLEQVADYVFDMYSPIYDAIGDSETTELHDEFKQKLLEYFK